MTAGWGEPDAAHTEGEEEHIPGAIDLGNGHHMTLNPAAFRKLLHSRQAVAAIAHRAKEIADAANEMAAHIGRPDRPDSIYSVTVTNDPSHTRARARIEAANYQAVLDNAINLTLLKAMDAFPSDPKHGHELAALAEETEE